LFIVYKYENNILINIKNSTLIFELNLNKTKHIIIFNIQNINHDLQWKLSFQNSSHLNNIATNCPHYDIERVYSIKYLEIYIDSHLKWNVHIDYIIDTNRKFLKIYDIYPRQTTT
jgi:hypothetical protein